MPLADAAKAHESMEHGAVKRRIVLQPQLIPRLPATMRGPRFTRPTDSGRLPARRGDRAERRRLVPHPRPDPQARCVDVSTGFSRESQGAKACSTIELIRRRAGAPVLRTRRCRVDLLVASSVEGRRTGAVCAPTSSREETIHPFFLALGARGSRHGVRRRGAGRAIERDVVAIAVHGRRRRTLSRASRLRRRAEDPGGLRHLRPR